MNKVETCLKSFNLIYTDTIERDTFARVGFDFEKDEVDYDNCISLYDLIYSFNKMHMTFKKEYEELDKLELGREIDINSFSKYVDADGNSYRVLDILVEKPCVVDDKYTYLYMREINGVSMPFITNDLGMQSDKGFYRTFVRLDAKKVKKYLDLFEKYQLLLDLYNYIKNQVVYGDGTFLLVTRIDSKENKFLDNMDSFRVSLGSNHVMDPGNHINIKINLGDELKADLNNCRINIGGEDLSIDNNQCIDILKKTFINGKYLVKPSSKKQVKEENNKVKILINNLHY